MVMGTVALAGIAVAATGCSGSFNTTTHHEPRSYEVSGSISKLDVRLDGADIEIVGADTDKVSVHERLSYSKNNKPVPEHRTENGTLVLRHKCPDKFTIGFSTCDVGYKIQVPRRMSVKVKNDSGDIRLRGFAGTAEVDTDSGNVEGTDLRESKVISQVDSGNIELSGAGDVKAKVDSGNIDLRELKGKQVDADADSGNIRLRFVTAPTSVTATADSGNVHLWLPTSVNGKEVKYALETNTDEGNRQNRIGTDASSSNRIKATADAGNVTIDPA